MVERKKRVSNDFLLDDIHDHRINRNDFTIYVGGDPIHHGNLGEEPGVDYSMADRFEMNLNVLTAMDPKRPILVQMASCGGSWLEGMQMFAAILYCPNPVTFLSTKDSRSMSSIIPLAADKYVLRPPGKYMYHHGTYGIWSLDQEVQTEDIERRKTNEMMYRLYIARLHSQGKFKGADHSVIRNALRENVKEDINVWLDADEAAEWGFTDGVFTGDFTTLRAKKKNLARRQMFSDVLRVPIKVEVKVS